MYVCVYVSMVCDCVYSTYLYVSLSVCAHGTCMSVHLCVSAHVHGHISKSLLLLLSSLPSQPLHIVHTLCPPIALLSQLRANST